MPAPPDAALAGADHYGHRYESKQRLASYWHQIDECFALGAQRVLVVGVGTGTVPFLLAQRGFEVSTLDLEPSLGAAVLGDVRALPFTDRAFDVAVCSQVLEHMPFSEFEKSLRELRRVTDKGLVLSLPDIGRYLKLDVVLPRTVRKVFFDLPQLRRRQWEFNGEHYWELNAKGYKREVIDRAIRASGFHIAKSFRVLEQPYHRFWRLT